MDANKKRKIAGTEFLMAGTGDHRFIYTAEGEFLGTAIREPHYSYYRGKGWQVGDNYKTHYATLAGVASRLHAIRESQQVSH